MRENATDFVALEVADQVPVDGRCRRWPGSLGRQRLRLIPEFLGATFAEVRAAGGSKFERRIYIDVFGYSDEQDLISTAASRFGGAGDSLLDAVEIIGDGHGGNDECRMTE